MRSPKHAFLLLVPLLLIGAGTRPTEPDRNQPEPPPPAPAVMTVYDWMTVLPAPATSPAFQPPPGQRVSWPLLGVITQPFGCTGFVLEKGTTACPSGFHTGIDIARPQGTAIAAAGPGLAYPFTDDQRYGNHVIIQMEGGLSTIYGHMVRMNVAWGQPVQAGDVIGWVGSTGNSTGPHVHFEVRYGGVAFDPMTYLDGSPPDPYPLPEGWPGAPPDDSIGRR